MPELGKFSPEWIEANAGFVAEPDAATFKMYGSIGIREGKFVRIGDMVLVAPRGELSHAQMILLGFQHPNTELQHRVTHASEQVESEKDLSGYGWGLVDAGRLELASELGRLKLSVWGLSSDYGRADEAGRQESVDLIRAKVPEALVVDLGDGQPPHH